MAGDAPESVQAGDWKMRCPKCKLVCPESQRVCDCGYILGELRPEDLGYPSGNRDLKEVLGSLRNIWPRAAGSGPPRSGTPRNVNSAIAQARSKIQDNRGSAYVAADSLEPFVVVGNYHSGDGTRNFDDWSVRMVADLGEESRPYLRQIWSRLTPPASPPAAPGPKTATAQVSAQMARGGIPLDLIGDMLTVGAYHIEDGLTDFAEWSKVMLDKHGEVLRPYLQIIWDAAHEWLAAARLHSTDASDCREPAVQAPPEPAAPSRIAESVRNIIAMVSGPEGATPRSAEARRRRLLVYTLWLVSLLAAFVAGRISASRRPHHFVESRAFGVAIDTDTGQLCGMMPAGRNGSFNSLPLCTDVAKR